MITAMRKPDGYWIKRCMDVGLLILAMPLILPVLFVVAGMIFFTLGTPLLFVQARAGLHGVSFRMYKFRSMRDVRDAHNGPLPDAERLTRFGRFLRSTSLDELPELWNVLKGEMSLVGPRPLLLAYLPRYTSEQMRRHDVLPGLTGYAQVNGRNTLSWDNKFAWDLRYVKERSLLLDMRILIATLAQVLLRRGISATGEATMPEFKGSQKNTSAK